MIICYTSKKEPFKVDDEDYWFVSQRKWCKDKNGYLTAQFDRKKIKLHRALMGFPIGMEIDHIDGDVSNNQKSNLRICTHSQNAKNVKVRSPHGKKSQYKGVSYIEKNKRKWLAYVYKDKKCFYREPFYTEKEAALAYNEYARIAHGDFAKLNKI